MSKLNLGGIQFPRDAVTHTFGILAVRGAGKSNTGAVLAEEMYANKLPFVVIDPVGAWWGLRSPGPGAAKGLSIPIFGGKHADVPLERGSGNIIADLIAEKRLSCIIDLSQFEDEAPKKEFLLSFAKRIYFKNENPLHLFLEEADDYIPQKPIRDELKLLRAWENIVRRGRGRGLGCTLITQRSAVLNKNVLSQVETLLPMRTTSPQDTDAIAAWVKYHGQKAELLASLSGLDDGEAWVWSPHWLKIMQRVQFRRRYTFDSGATPKENEVSKAVATLADVDISTLKDKMAATIERAKETDPVLLQRTVAELRQQNRILQMAQPVASPLPEPVPVPVPVLDDATKSLLEKFDMRVEDWSKGSVAILTELRALRETISMATQNAHKLAHRATPQASYAKPRAVIQKVEVPRKTKPEPTPLRQVASVTQAEPVDRALSKPEKAILSVLASFPEGCEVGKIALLSGYKQSGTFMSALSWLRMRGLLIGENSAVMQITDEGLDQGPFEAIPTGQQAIEYWANFRHFGKPEKCIIRALASANGNGMTKEELCEATGYEIPPSGTFMSALSALRTAGLLIGKNSELMQLSDILRS